MIALLTRLLRALGTFFRCLLRTSQSGRGIGIDLSGLFRKFAGLLGLLGKAVTLFLSLLGNRLFQCLSSLI